MKLSLGLVDLIGGIVPNGMLNVAFGSDSERLAVSTTSPEVPQKAEVLGALSHFRVGPEAELGLTVPMVFSLRALQSRHKLPAESANVHPEAGLVSARTGHC